MIEYGHSMVTSRHEASHRIFQGRPELITPVFGVLGVRIPHNPVVEVLPTDVTEMHPVERRVDTVLRLQPDDGTQGLILAIEAQGRRDEKKPSSWGYYLSYLSAKYDCPTLLLVVCQDKTTAEWAAGPFHHGWGGWTALTVRPLALGPGNIPLITDSDQAAEHLAFAAFSAITHGRHPNSADILEALAKALATADQESRDYYSEMLEIGLGENTPAQDLWSKLMKNGSYFPGRGTLAERKFLEGKSEGTIEGKAEGKIEGVAESVLLVLESRGIDIPDETRDRILHHPDREDLMRWLTRSLTVTTAEELFEDTV